MNEQGVKEPLRIFPTTTREGFIVLQAVITLRNKMSRGGWVWVRSVGQCLYHGPTVCICECVMVGRRGWGPDCRSWVKNWGESRRPRGFFSSWGSSFSFLCFLRVFKSYKWMFVFGKCFLFIDMIMWFFFSFSLSWWIVLTGFQMLNQSCIPGMNPLGGRV